MSERHLMLYPELLAPFDTHAIMRSLHSGFGRYE